MLQQLEGGELRQASVADIEAGLSAMWRSAAAGEEAHAAVTRATALTLLVYVESEDAAHEVSNLIADVTRQNPCRTVLMLVEPGASPKGLSAAVSAHCQMPVAGEKQICSEQITLHARGEAGPELASVVLPLTVSGLPIYLWWRAGSFNVPAYFDQILRVTQHVIVDSARFTAGRADLRDLAYWLQLNSGRVRVSDLNWARATPWRELIAQCFDSADRRPYLDRIREVHIEYDQGSTRYSTQRAQSLLLAAWLATRLGWEFRSFETREENQPRVYYFRSHDREIKVERVLRKPAGESCGVCFSIELKAENARFSFVRDTDGKVVQTLAEVPGRAAIGRTVRVEVLDEVEILNEELKLGGRDHVYEEALALVARMTNF